MDRIVKWFKLILWLVSNRKILLFDHDLFKSISWLYFSQVYMNSVDYKQINSELIPIAEKLLPLQLRENNELLRVGSQNDGGYVVVDDLKYPVVSIGIGTNSEFDHDMCERKVKVYQFDHTIDLEEKCCENSTFYKIGLTHSKDFRSEKLLTLDEIANMCNIKEEASAILKIDVEGAEWKVFADPNVEKSLKLFRQIIFEGHNLQKIIDKDFRRDFVNALNNLSEKFAVVNYHGNNNLPGVQVLGLFMPQTFELTMVRKELYISERKQESLSEENAVNNPNRKEILDHLSSLRNFLQSSN